MSDHILLPPPPSLSFAISLSIILPSSRPFLSHLPGPPPLPPYFTSVSISMGPDQGGRVISLNLLFSVSSPLQRQPTAESLELNGVSIGSMRKLLFFSRLPEDPSVNARHAGDPASNGFSVFVVQRHEKMKFADRLTEIICSHKGVFFISTL